MHTLIKGVRTTDPSTTPAQLDLLLVNAPLRDYSLRPRVNDYTLPVLGMAYIATYAASQGFTVGVLDAEAAGLPIADTVSLINQSAPRWAGFNLLAPTYEISADIVAALDPHIRVMVGGHHAKAMPQRILADPRMARCDALVIGEAETRVVELLADHRNRTGLPGVMWRGPVLSTPVSGGRPGTGYHLAPDETLYLLAACGLREVALGIESGSERMLAYIDKRIAQEVILSVVQRLTIRGIKVKGYFILGFPTETRAEMAETVGLAHRLWDLTDGQAGAFRASVFQFRPYHGTPEWGRLMATGRYTAERLLDYAPVDLGAEDAALRGRDEFNFSSRLQFGEATEEEIHRHLADLARVQHARRTA